MDEVGIWKVYKSGYVGQGITHELRQRIYLCKLETNAS